MKQKNIIRNNIISHKNTAHMQTITGKSIILNPDGSIWESEIYSIEAGIGSQVIFTDNTALGNCYINSPIEKDMDLAGYYKQPNASMGRIAKTDSQQQAKYEMYGIGNKVVEMPIAVICDNGEIIYCNPLNIRVIDKEEQS